MQHKTKKSYLLSWNILVAIDFERRTIDGWDSYGIIRQVHQCLNVIVCDKKNVVLGAHLQQSLRDEWNNFQIARDIERLTWEVCNDTLQHLPKQHQTYNHRWRQQRAHPTQWVIRTDLQFVARSTQREAFFSAPQTVQRWIGPPWCRRLGCWKKVNSRCSAKSFNGAVSKDK